MIERLGYRADVAANGSEAVTMVEVGKYDAVLMDCQMPEMDGYEATRQSGKQNHRAGTCRSSP
jgi:CheY-like chemotaxis protein